MAAGGLCSSEGTTAKGQASSSIACPVALALSSGCSSRGQFSSGLCLAFVMETLPMPGASLAEFIRSVVWEPKDELWDAAVHKNLVENDVTV